MTIEKASARNLQQSRLGTNSNEQKSVQVEAQTVKDAVDALLEKYPTLSKHLLDSKGSLRSFINLYVGDEDIRSLDGLETELEAGAELSIIPSIAGGFV